MLFRQSPSRVLIADVALDLQRLLEILQRLVVVPPIRVEVAEVDEGQAGSFLVADLALDLQRLLVAGERGIQVAQLFLDLGDPPEGHGDATLLADAALDLERFLVVPLRFARLVQPLVGRADGVEHVGLLLVLPELDGEAQGLVQEVERSLRVPGLDLHAARRQEGGDVLRIVLEDLLVVGASLVEGARGLVEGGQLEVDLGVVRRRLGEVLVGRDRLVRVVDDPGVAGVDEIFLRRRKPLGELHGVARALLGLRVVPQAGVGLAQLRVREGELRVGLNRRLELLQRLGLLALAGELQPFVVGAQRLERFRRRLERGGLQLRQRVRGERKPVADRLGELIDGGLKAALAGSLRLQRRWTAAAVTSSSVASIRISLPNLRYCPQITVSALLNFASFRRVAGSKVESAEIRRSRRI